MKVPILSEQRSNIQGRTGASTTSVIFHEPEHDDRLGGIEQAVEVEVEQIEKVFHFQSSRNFPVHRQHGEHLNKQKKKTCHGTACVHDVWYLLQNLTFSSARREPRSTRPPRSTQAI